MPTDVAQILYVKKLTKIQYDLINFGRKINNTHSQTRFFLSRYYSYLRLFFSFLIFFQYNIYFELLLNLDERPELVAKIALTIWDLLHLFFQT